MPGRQYISGREYGALIAAGTLSFGLFSFPRDIVLHAGHGALFSMILIFLMAAAGVWAVEALAKMLPGQALFESALYILGGWVGRAAMVLVAGFYLLWLGAMLRQASDMVRMQLLRETPLEVIQFILLLVAAYLAALGIEALGRFCVVAMTPSVIFIITIYLIAWQNVELAEAKPLYEGNWLGIVISATHAFYMLAGVQLAAHFVAFVRPRERSKTKRQSFTSLTVLWSLLLLALLITIGELGVPVVKTVNWPGIMAVNLVEVPGAFIEKLGLFILVIWTLIVAANLAVVAWAASILSAKIGGMDMAKGRYLLLPLMVSAYWVSIASPNQAVMEGVTLHVVSYIGIFTTVILPYILLAAAKLRGLGNSATQTGKESGK